jgi:hypothetical protein
MTPNWIGQINAIQARAIIIRMALVGTVSALGMALAFGIAQAIYYLNSGQTPPEPKV